MTDESEIRSPYFPHPKQLCSNPLYLFLWDYYNVLDLFFFTVHLAQTSDKAQTAINKALRAVAPSEAEKKKYEDGDISKNFEKLADFSFLHSKNIVNNIVDSFLWYLSTIIQESMKRRPELIKSGETVKIEEVFEYKSRRELVNYLIDRRINSLSYGGMKAIESFVQESLGIDVFHDEEQRTLMKIFIEVRNINAHNRGRANRLFMKRVNHDKRFQFEDGEPVFLNYDKIVLLSDVCINTALNLDKKISKKFKIERKKYATWRATAKKSSDSSESSANEPPL